MKFCLSWPAERGRNEEGDGGEPVQVRSTMNADISTVVVGALREGGESVGMVGTAGMGGEGCSMNDAEFRTDPNTNGVASGVKPRIVGVEVDWPLTLLNGSEGGGTLACRDGKNTSSSSSPLASGGGGGFGGGPDGKNDSEVRGREPNVDGGLFKYAKLSVIRWM